MKQRQETVVRHEDLPEWAQFQASLTAHPIIRDEHGVLRYQLNPLVDYTQSKANLNEMWILYQHGTWSREVFMQFYRDIGYSLSGFEEVWGDELSEMEERQIAEAERT